MRYAKLKDNLSNNMTNGVDNFTKTIMEMMRLMTDYKVLPRAKGIRAGMSKGLPSSNKLGEMLGERRGRQGHPPRELLSAGTVASKGTSSTTVRSWPTMARQN